MIDELPPAVIVTLTRHTPAGVPAPTVKMRAADEATTQNSALVPLTVAEQEPPSAAGTKFFPFTVTVWDMYAIV